MKQSIGYDIDGCICESAPYFMMRMMEIYGLQPDEFKLYNSLGNEMFDFKLPKGVDIDEVLELIADSIERYHCLFDEVLGAIRGIRDIMSITVEDPIFITARDKRCEKPFEKWIKAHGIDTPFMLHSVKRHEDKAKMVEAFGLTHFVEDRYRTAHQLAEVGVKVYLINKPYNDRPIWNDNIKRVWNWSEIVEDYLKGE